MLSDIFIVIGEISYGSFSGFVNGEIGSKTDNLPQS
jgi:hypothetical protein